jgi:hypothetical protein
MHKKFFDPPAFAFRQAPSSRFIGRGVTFRAGRSFVVANIYFQPAVAAGRSSNAATSVDLAASWSP